MTLQLEIEGVAVPSIPTKRGRMKCSSLRPGDFVKVPDIGQSIGSTLCILINSKKHSRFVAFWVNTREEVSWTYETLIGGSYQAVPAFEYLGHGSKRRWHAWLPKFLQRRICPFNRPKP